jgi:hypothetical protein
MKQHSRSGHSFALSGIIMGFLSEVSVPSALRTVVVSALFCAVFCTSTTRAGDEVVPDKTCLAAAAALVPLDRVKTLPNTPPLKHYPGAVIIRSGDPLSRTQKEDGIYVYLVVRHADHTSLIWSLREQGEVRDRPSNFATHDSLYAQAEEKLGKVEVLAAGQVVQANGLVARIDNHSSTRQGDASHLAFAENELSKSGLKFVDEGNVHTQRVDLKTQKNPDYLHREDAGKTADLRFESDAIAARKMTSELILAWHHTIYVRYPEFHHSTIPGYLDLEKFFAVDRLYPKRKPVLHESAAILETKDVFRILQREGVEAATRYLMAPEFESNGSVPRITREARFREILRLALEPQT